MLHTAALISIAEKMPPHLYDVNVDGVKERAPPCAGNTGVRRLVHVSSVHAIPELPAGQVMREPVAFSAGLVNGGYAKTKAEAAQAVLDAAEEGLDAVMVFPSGHPRPLRRRQATT
jgi:dihydroflavonol-4-reductase